MHERSRCLLPMRMATCSCMRCVSSAELASSSPSWGIELHRLVQGRRAAFQVISALSLHTEKHMALFKAFCRAVLPEKQFFRLEAQKGLWTSRSR